MHPSDLCDAGEAGAGRAVHKISISRMMMATWQMSRNSGTAKLAGTNQQTSGHSHKTRAATTITAKKTAPPETAPTKTAPPQLSRQPQQKTQPNYVTQARTPYQ